MIDWLTLRASISEEVRTVLKPHFEHMLKVKSGEILFAVPVRQNLRSDSHQININLCGDLEISGSPARAGDHNNVFGSDNIQESAGRMIRFVADHFNVELPELTAWDCNRIDVTYNYDMGSESNVNQALEYLAHASASRIKPNHKHSTVYWNQHSSYQAGKAYGKGQHLHYQTKRSKAKATLKEIHYSRRLLRLETVNRKKFLKRLLNDLKKPWYELTELDLQSIHSTFFDRLIPELEVTDMNPENIVQTIVDKKGCTPLQAKNAYKTYIACKTMGLAQTQSVMSPRTFRRHASLLAAAGIKSAELSHADVRPLRKKALVIGEPVRNWDHLYQLAQAA